MSTLSVLKMYLKLQSMPRLPIPHLGNAGILYTSSLIDRNRAVYKAEVKSTTDRPEINGAEKGMVSKNPMGSFWFRRYSTTTEDIKRVEKERSEKNKFKLRTAETIKILLVSETGSLEAVTLEEANKIAKKKRLNLVHIENPKDKPIKTEKEVYKLVSTLKEMDEEDSEASTSKGGSRKTKELKTVLLKSSIAEHDLNAKANSMLKWIKKDHRVRVIISQAGDKGDAETIFSQIQSKVKDVEGEIQQKTKKGNQLSFYIMPPKTPTSSAQNQKSQSKETLDDKRDDQSGKYI